MYTYFTPYKKQEGCGKGRFGARAQLIPISLPSIPSSGCGKSSLARLTRFVENRLGDGIPYETVRRMWALRVLWGRGKRGYGLGRGAGR